MSIEFFIRLIQLFQFTYINKFTLENVLSQSEPFLTFEVRSFIVNYFFSCLNHLVLRFNALSHAKISLYLAQQSVFFFMSHVIWICGFRDEEIYNQNFYRKSLVLL